MKNDLSIQKNYDDINIDDLMDIRDVIIDTSLPLEERIKDLLRQVKNPDVFRYGNRIIKFTYADTDKTIDDVLMNHIKRNQSWC